MQNTKTTQKIEQAPQQLGPIKLIFWYVGPTHTHDYVNRMHNLPDLF